MARRKKINKLSRRDAKIEIIKTLMELLASKGFAYNWGLSNDRFKFYCECAGGVPVNYGRLICKRKDFDLKVLHYK